MGVFAYTELTSRLVSLETSRELFENDLLKKSEQVPVDQEQLFLLEDLYKIGREDRDADRGYDAQQS